MNDARKRSRRFMGQAGIAVPLLVCFAVTGACSKKVELKQDTPAATVSTIVKLYAAGDDGHWGDVVEPALAHAAARDNACIAETMRSLRCVQAEVENMRCYPRRCAPTPDGCPVDVAKCTCGATGTQAAAGATSFVGTSAYTGLKAAKLNLATCSITDSTSLTPEQLKQRSPAFWDDVCSDVAQGDEFAAVTLKCSGTDPLVFILHNKSAKWGLVAFDTDTFATLATNAAAHAAASAADQRAKDLNKDMK